MNTAGWSENLPAAVAGRRDQMFPQLTDADIARIRRFGEVRRYARGERLFAAGEPAAGMFVVLKGTVAVSLRDGLGHVVPIAKEGPGHFLGGGFAAFRSAAACGWLRRGRRRGAARAAAKIARADHCRGGSR